MPTPDDIDDGQRRRPRLRWLVALVAVVAAAAAAVLLRGVGDSDPADAGGELDLPEQLAARVVEILEQATPEQHHDHGHEIDEEAEGLVCAAETFGFTPPDAGTVDEVEEAYLHYMCAEVGVGLPWPTAILASGPTAVEFTDPPTVRIPEEALPGEEGTSHADRVRAIIPEEHHDHALAEGGFGSQAVMDTLQQRFEVVDS